MAVHFWSDPHLGVRRNSNSTPQSRIRLQQAVFAAAKEAADLENSHCLGDLFDTTANTEEVILQGSLIAERCKTVLSGNHDLPNHEGKLSSLQLLVELAGGVGEDGSPWPAYIHPGSTNIGLVLTRDVATFLVPHKLTQALFDATLEAAPAKVDEVAVGARTKVLCLHCNYNSNFAVNESELNLTREQAEKLLEVFDYVLLGHEHIPRSDFDGRLRILGNLYPTSFADISDKYVWRLENGNLTPIKVWDASSGAEEIPWEDLLSGRLPGRDTQFITITGTAPANRMAEISRATHALWAKSPEAFLIRSKVQSEEMLIEKQAFERLVDVPTRITNELKSTPLLTLWQTYLEKLA